MGGGKGNLENIKKKLRTAKCECYAVKAISESVLPKVEASLEF